MPDEPSKPATYAEAAASATTEGGDHPPPYGQTDTSISVTGISSGKGDGAAAGAPAAGPSTQVHTTSAPAPSPAAFTHPAPRAHHPHHAPHRGHDARHAGLGRHRDVEAGVVLFIPEREIALARARRRFFGALCWAFVIYLVLASITGSTIHDVARRGRHGHWDKQGVWHANGAGGGSGTTVV
ncbi:hypothetical protein Q8F55_008772 [Vanrija albida]|uniref:Uncharacterized protein n=1 Tax=Vanrija albida TaxID=181172 RepID=A0ABR3PRS3_9TREE